MAPRIRAGGLFVLEEGGLGKKGETLKSYLCKCAKGFPGGSVVKKPPANAADAGDMSSIP